MMYHILFGFGKNTYSQIEIDLLVIVSHQHGSLFYDLIFGTLEFYT